MAPECFPLIGDDGEVIARVQGDSDMSAASRAALTELVAAARRRFAADCAADPSIGERQAASIRRIRARTERLTGGRTDDVITPTDT